MQHWAERSTLSMALLVVACEGLKPAGLQFKDHDLYPVIDALLGQQVVERLRRWENSLRPQEVRNAHLHRGVFLGSEFVEAAMWSSFRDPSFDQARRELTRITQAAVIEWLRRGGAVTLLPLNQPSSIVRKWLRQRSLALLPVALAVGIGLGWLLRAVSS
jgi:hypothetical protein